MKTIGTFEAKTHLSQIIQSVEKNNEEYLVQKRGKNVAIIVPYISKIKKANEELIDEVINGVDEIRKNIKLGLPKNGVKSLINEGRKY